MKTNTHFWSYVAHFPLEWKKRVASNVPIVAIDVTTKNEWEGPRELVRPWGSGVGSALHSSGVTSDNGPAVTSRNCVLDPRKNETLDVTSKKFQKKVGKGTTHILASITSCRKYFRLWDNVEKCGIARQATDDNVAWGMSFACWVPKATNTHTHTKNMQ